MQYSNYHTHTKFCDGSSDPEEYVLQAISLGMSHLGFSAHAPVPFDNEWSLKYENREAYLQEIRSLKIKYKDQIKIHLALEMDYIPGVTDDFHKIRKQDELDYIIGSVHLVRNGEKPDLWFIDGPESNYISGIEEVFENNIRHAVETFYGQTNEMIEKFSPEVIGHLDKVKMNNKNRYFNRTESWYQPALRSTLETIKKHDSIVEVNTRGIYKGKIDELFPDISVLKMIRELNIPVTISTDAHKPHELVLFFDETCEILLNLGFKTIRYFDGKNWEETLIIK